jgi:peptidylprolyl isomerase
LRRFFFPAPLLWLVAFSIVLGIGGCAKPSDTPGDPTAEGPILIEDLIVGGGTVLGPADTAIVVNYIGYLVSGEIFDSNLPTGIPVRFNRFRGQLISGFELGVTEMRIGGVRRVTVWLWKCRERWRASERDPRISDRAAEVREALLRLPVGSHVSDRRRKG